MNRMIRVLLLVLVASIVVPYTVSAPPASAVSSPTEPQHHYTVTVTGTPVDGAGKATGPTRTLLQESQFHPCSGDTCTNIGSTSLLSAAYVTGGVPTSYGGLQLHVWVNDRETPLGSLLYTWHQRVTWTWGFGTIGSMRVEKWLDNKAWFVSGNGAGTRGNATYYYTWCCGVGKSGHYSMRSQAVSQCWAGCWYNADPWIWIRAHGNGTYSYDWGIDR
jgi:hypothetical protein